MITIKLPTNPTDSQFAKLSREWDSATDAKILLPRKMSDAERDALVRFLLSKIRTRSLSAPYAISRSGREFRPTFSLAYSTKAIPDARLPSACATI